MVPIHVPHRLASGSVAYWALEQDFFSILFSLWLRCFPWELPSGLNYTFNNRVNNSLAKFPPLL